MSRSARAILVSIVGLLLLLGAGPTLAADPEPLPSGVVYDIDYEACWVSGTAPAGARLHVRWLSAGARVKQDLHVTADGRGRWETPCDFFEHIERGDRVVTTLAGRTYRLRIRRLAGRIDRVRDRVTGVARAGETLAVRASAWTWTAPPTTVWRPVTTRPDGTFRLDLAGTLDLRGGDSALIEWSRPNGDRVRRSIDAPSISISRGDAGIFVEAAAGTPVTVELLAPGGARRATVSDKTNFIGGFNNAFTDAHGDPVRPRAGDTVHAPGLATDAVWVVPPVSVSGSAATDRAVGRCIPHGEFLLGTFRSGADGYSLEPGRARADGTFRVRMELRRGHRLMLRCQLPTGDVVGRLVTVE